jgi:hypothetical protein
MNIYEKMTEAKKMILKSNLKKSGENKFAGFKYYELADITPTIIDVCSKLKLHTRISFDKEYATLTITNIENIEEQLIYQSPMKELSLKGCNDIQALGGVETYSRRYLYLTAFDIIENDMFDAKSGTKDNEVTEESKLKKEIKSYGQKASELLKAKGKRLSELNIKQLEELLNKLQNDI